MDVQNPYVNYLLSKERINREGEGHNLDESVTNPNFPTRGGGQSRKCAVGEVKIPTTDERTTVVHDEQHRPTIFGVGDAETTAEAERLVRGGITVCIEFLSARGDLPIVAIADAIVAGARAGTRFRWPTCQGGDRESKSEENLCEVGHEEVQNATFACRLPPGDRPVND